MLELPTFWLLGVKSFKSLAASDTLSRNNNRVIFCPFACFATFCLILFVFFCPSNLCCLLSRTVEVRTFQNEEGKAGMEISGCFLDDRDLTSLLLIKTGCGSAW